MSNYTNGPWKLDVTPNGCPIKEVLAADGRGVCEIYEGDSPDKVWANANLIACAPDLVIELRQAIIQMEMAAECIEKGRHDEALLHVSSLMRSKKEVLAKATGESA